MKNGSGSGSSKDRGSGNGSGIGTGNGRGSGNGTGITSTGPVDTSCLVVSPQAVLEDTGVWVLEFYRSLHDPWSQVSGRGCMCAPTRGAQILHAACPCLRAIPAQ